MGVWQEGEAAGLPLPRRGAPAPTRRSPKKPTHERVAPHAVGWACERGNVLLATPTCSLIRIWLSLFCNQCLSRRRLVTNRTKESYSDRKRALKWVLAD